MRTHLDPQKQLAKRYLMTLPKGNLASMLMRYAGRRMVQRWAAREEVSR